MTGPDDDNPYASPTLSEPRPISATRMSVASAAGEGALGGFFRGATAGAWAGGVAVAAVGVMVLCTGSRVGLLRGVDPFGHVAFWITLIVFGLGNGAVLGATLGVFLGAAVGAATRLSMRRSSATATFSATLFALMAALIAGSFVWLCHLNAASDGDWTLLALGLATPLAAAGGVWAGKGLGEKRFPAN